MAKGLGVTCFSRMNEKGFSPAARPGPCLKFRNPSRFDQDMKISSEKVWYGEGVLYGNEGESILISLILWAYAKNLVQIHQDLAEL